MKERSRQILICKSAIIRSLFADPLHKISKKWALSTFWTNAHLYFFLFLSSLWTYFIYTNLRHSCHRHLTLYIHLIIKRNTINLIIHKIHTNAILGLKLSNQLKVLHDTCQKNILPSSSFSNRRHVASKERGQPFASFSPALWRSKGFFLILQKCDLILKSLPQLFRNHVKY